jgi:signal transduction histidine kinase/ligand-binding sensor domain-containing protein
VAAQIAAPPAGFAVSSWTTADGLPQSSIAGLARDREGYLWVGTASGLARFDGDSFVTYPRDPTAEPFKTVSDMTTDARGVIWVAGADSGIARLDQYGRLTSITAPPVSRPLHVAVGPADSVWMGFFGQLWLHADSRWQRPAEVPENIVGEVQAILVDASGTVWFGGGRGLARLEPGARLAQPVAGLSCAYVWSLAPAGRGDVWVGTCGGVVRVSARGTVERLMRDHPAGARVRSLRAEGDSVLWFGDRDGVHRLQVTRESGSSWRARTTFTASLDLAGAEPNVLLAGANGSIWVGTTGAGLRLIRPLLVGRLTLADGLPDRPVHHLVPDGKGGLWLGGGCSGLVRWRLGEVRTYRPPALGLESFCARGLLRDRAGNLWIGEVGRMSRLDTAGHSVEMVRRAGGSIEVIPMLEDSEGRVWFGTTFGILGYVARDGSTTMLPDTTLSPHKVWSMVEDETGVWVGQVGELTHLVNGRVDVRFRKAEGMPPGPIRGLAYDRDGDLWIASYGGGLARLRGGSDVQRLPPGGRRFEQALSAIVIDRADRFWFLGDGGLTMMAPGELSAAVDEGRPVRGAVELGLPDGVPEGNGGYPNAWIDRTVDRLWVGTVDGVVTVDLPRFPRGATAPRLRIDDVRIDGKHMATLDSVVVPVGANALEIRFTAPTFGGPDDLRFRYRLRGHDRDWIESGATRVARYASLAPGRYTFDLIGRSRDGVERSAPLALAVTVVPAWWQTTLARVVFVLLGLGLMWFAFLALSRRLRERARVLQHQISVREQAEAQAAAAARDLAHVSRLATAGELATSIAHELNQPLTAVVGSAQTARRLLNGQGQEAVRELLDAIVVQSDRAAGVIRSLRAFVLKQRSADELLSPETVVADTLQLMRQELAVRGVTTRVVNELRPGARVRGDAVQLQQVLVNLVLNAADAMSSVPASNRRATVLVRSDDAETVRISVFDTGKGLEPDALARVFDPFFTTKPGGLGLGLSLSHSIVEAHSGRLWAESAPGKGSAFHIHLPVSLT